MSSYHWANKLTHTRINFLNKPISLLLAFQEQVYTQCLLMLYTWLRPTLHIIMLFVQELLSWVGMNLSPLQKPRQVKGWFPWISIIELTMIEIDNVPSFMLKKAGLNMAVKIKLFTRTSYFFWLAFSKACHFHSVCLLWICAKFSCVSSELGQFPVWGLRWQASLTVQ